MRQPVVWTIAGADSCGGAGISADLQTFHNLDVHACSVTTAITSQNLHHISNIHYLSENVIVSQLDALEQMHPRAIKIGMIGNAKSLEVLSGLLQKYNGFVVLDPLLISSSNKKLFAGDLENYIECLIKLFPNVSLLTPNRHEAEAILGRKITHFTEVEHAARELLKLGPKSILLKGGHFDGDFSQDFWTNGQESCWFASERHPDKDCHGTGCVFSSAVAASAAHGYEIKDALVIAKMYVNRGLRLAEPHQATTFFIHSQGWPEDDADLPYASLTPMTTHPPVFNGEDQSQFGLYPIVDSVEWLQTLLPLGINHFQLRIKNLNGDPLEHEIKRGIQLAKSYQAKLFINDYWELALRHGAYGVHLGQEDLDRADVAAIHASGMRLGISTHCYYEVARAHAFRPSYIACGPVFHTTSKVMKFAPLGLPSLSRWRKTLRYPLVAIGGIHQHNINDVAAENVDGIALISAITQADDPVAAAKILMHEASLHAA